MCKIKLRNCKLQLANVVAFFKIQITFNILLTFDMFSLCIFETCSALSCSKELIMLSLASFSSSSRLISAILISCSCFSLKSNSEAYKLISIFDKSYTSIKLNKKYKNKHLVQIVVSFLIVPISFVFSPSYGFAFCLSKIKYLTLN